METTQGTRFCELFISLFFLIGALFAGISYTIYRNSRNLIENGIETKGTVIDLHRLKPREYPLAPSIRYFTKEGTERISQLGSPQPRPPTREEVTLHYDPKDPENVHLHRQLPPGLRLRGNGLGVRAFFDMVCRWRGARHFPLAVQLKSH